jgi:hypothetical protein
MPLRRAVGVLGAVFFVWGCNAILGIEEQGVRPSVVVDAEAPDAGPNMGACLTDEDCAIADGCYTPHCTSGQCSYGLCEVAGKACAAGTCDPTTRTCSGSTDYGFRTTSYPTVAPACADASDCVVALWPFLFVGTSSGVTAMYVDDPLAAGARTIPVGGFDGPVGKLVVSGRRLWILGSPTSPDGGLATTLRIGYVDVATTPTLHRLDAMTTELGVPAPMTGFAAPDGALFVAIVTGVQGLDFASARLAPPLPTNGRFVLGGDAGASAGDGITLHPAAGLVPHALAQIVASSGERLIVHEPPSTYFAIAAPGTTAAQAEAKVVTTFPAAAGPTTFEQSAAGALLGVSAPPNDPASDCGCTSVARARWLFASKDDVAIDQATAIDTESYKNPQIAGQACHVCTGGYFSPIAQGVLLGANEALIAAPAGDPPANRIRTAVRLVTRAPAAADARRRFVLPTAEHPSGNFATDRLAFAADRGLGFLVVSDAANTARVSIFDPRCEAPLPSSADAGE